MGLPAPPEFFRAMSAVDNEGEFVCVVLLTNFSRRNVDVNIAIESDKVRPKATIEMFNRVFGLIFDKLKVVRATGLVSVANLQSQKATPKFGFKLEGRMRKALPNDEDIFIYGMLAEEYHQHPWCKKEMK